MIIEYQWASGKICEFDAYDFYLIGIEGYDEEPLCLIGKDDNTDFKSGRLTALQIVVDDNGKYHCAFVKQTKQKDYKKIIKAKDGEEVCLLSDISMGLWHSERYTKVKGLTPRLKYFLQEEPLILVDKVGMSMERGSMKFMVPNGNTANGGKIVFRSEATMHTPEI
jgi:hypothetical protein